MNRTDAELIEAHRRGDASAVEALVERHVARVRNLLFQLVLRRDEAEELTQEVFVNVLKNLSGFRSESAFTTWLHRIAVNVVRESQRRGLRRRTEEIAATHGETASSLSPPEAELIRREQDERVRLALERLTPPLRSAIVLTVMQGLSAVEAAEIEGCPVGTMYWRVSEARRKLREDLQEFLE